MTDDGRQMTEDGRRITEDGRRNPVSRITHHASRITSLPPRSPRAFTLIELLVVIAVIGVLAALTFPAASAVKIAAIRHRARSEMTQIETAIERYNQKLGFYPPDNPGNWAFPPLYYELLGTTNAGGTFHTLDDSAQLSASVLAGGTSPFGSGVTGFVNCSRPGKSDEGLGATAFVNGFKANQFIGITNVASSASCFVLCSALDGPPLPSAGGKLNPWRYNSSSPQHNPKSFDLWIDVTVGSKTNRICNWSDRAIVVNTLDL
jgi:prepilin-type N-terminal cleavage/methylation domain-containing protein